MQTRTLLPIAVDRRDETPSEEQFIGARLTRQIGVAKRLLADTSLVAIIALVLNLLTIITIVLLPILNQTRTNAVNEVSLKAVENNQKAMADGFAALSTQLTGLKDDLKHAQEEAKRFGDDMKRVGDDMRAMRASWEAQMIDLRVRIDSASLDIGNVKTKLAAIEARQQERSKQQ